MAQKRRAFLVVEAVVAVLLLYLVGIYLLDTLPLYQRLEKQSVVQNQVLLLSQIQGDAALANPTTIGAKESTATVDSRPYRVKTEILVSSFPHLNQVTVSIYTDDGRLALQRAWFVEVP